MHLSNSFSLCDQLKIDQLLLALALTLTHNHLQQKQQQQNDTAISAYRWPVKVCFCAIQFLDCVRRQLIVIVGVCVCVSAG